MIFKNLNSLYILFITRRIGNETKKISQPYMYVCVHNNIATVTSFSSGRKSTKMKVESLIPTKSSVWIYSYGTITVLRNYLSYSVSKFVYTNASIAC